MSETIKIFCANCKAYILDAFVDKLKLPFKGWMFKYPDHVEWDTAFEPEATGHDLVCPMCEWQFHDEPRLLTSVVPFEWNRIIDKGIFPKEKIDKAQEELGPETASEIYKRIKAIEEEEKHDGQGSEEVSKEEARDGRGKKKEGQRRISKPAIRTNAFPGKKRDGSDSDRGASDKRADKTAKRFAQLEELAAGGINIDESPGYSAE